MEEQQATPSAVGAPAPKNSPKAKMMTRAAVRHAAPFFLWVGILLIAQMMHLTEGSATEEIGSLNLFTDASLYALRTVLCTVVFLLLRPWTFYAPLARRNILPALGLGAAVCFLWVFFETPFFKGLFPDLATAYETWCVMPAGELREPLEATPYAPGFCGWPLTLVRLAGSAFVIAVIEEFFWRGYLLRTLRTPDFLDIDIGEFHLPSFLIVAAIFGFEHAEWAVGIVTGLVYGWFYIRTRDIWAVALAHVATNLLLGVYVLATGSWQFW
ncbi:MAG: CAAX prenyl protease-related protein [Kiritimatiellia bacterium]|jgi:CAAX prenyl protease-like protein